MKWLTKRWVIWVILAGGCLAFGQICRGQVRAWEGTITIPTYDMEEDINPKFWALEGAAKGSTTIRGATSYPYTMQDHLYRTKADKTYKAFFLENKYLKITCLPELGGRLHSVFDKTRGEEMFHTNGVIKPSMIATRGAFISGGVEWNAGPHGHTVTIMSPVDVVIGENPDGSAYLEASNLEKTLRTRWRVRVTLHPGKAYLDERMRIFNPTDAMQPYYFWNCTAFPCRQGTRFIYPMTLGTDHNGVEFFKWPIHEGKDLSWLKNYETYSSIFSVECTYDFFGAYDVDMDRGIVQVADHHELSGKKAWTWGQWDFGLVAQQNLTDEDGPYIEVQSGPLPTQSDYGMLGPREEVAWQEWWLPVHGLGDGFEFATRDLAIQTSRQGGKLQLRMIATGEFPGSTCTIVRGDRQLLKKKIDLSPAEAQALEVSVEKSEPVDVTVQGAGGKVLARFTTPLPIPVVNPPDPSAFVEKPDEQLTVEEKYLKGLKFDRATDRTKARGYYEMALEDDPQYVHALRQLAVLDVEAANYDQARAKLEKALERKPNDDGLSWYFLGVCHLQFGDLDETLRCAYRAARCQGTVSVGHDLAGRAFMQQKKYGRAAKAFRTAVRANTNDTKAQNHLLLARYARDGRGAASATEDPGPRLERRITRNPTDLVPRALVALQNEQEMQRFVGEARDLLGEVDFQMIELSLVFAEVGLLKEAGRLLQAVCVDAPPEDQRSGLPLYYLAYYAWQAGEQTGALALLGQAAATHQERVFPSRPQAAAVLELAVAKNPTDARAHLQLGNLYAHFARLDEAAVHWTKASDLDGSLNIAWRNLGLYARAVENDPTKAAAYYVKAIAAQPDDQTLYRDLADVLIIGERREEAIALLEAMPTGKLRRSGITILLARAYLDDKRYDDCLELLEATPYFVAWEGQRTTHIIFTSAHMGRGIERYEEQNYAGALGDFTAALTYPKNLGVGRTDKPEEAEAQYWRGKALEAVGQTGQARQAWQHGADLPESSEQHNTYRQLCAMALVVAN